MELKKYLDSSVKGLLVILTFLLGQSLIALPIVAFNIEARLLVTIILILGHLVVSLLMIYILRDVLKKHLVDLKKNHKSYFKKYFKYWFLILGGMAIINLIIMALPFTEGVAANQEAVLELLRRSPVYIYFAAVIFAPLTEELAFRQAIRQIIPNDKVFILVSGLSFGLIHIIAADNFVSQLPFLLSYSFPGFVFAYLLIKSENIFVPIGLHFIHNGVLVSLQLLLMIFGGL